MKADLKSLYSNEESLRTEFRVIAGIDEAGRGPIAGPAVVAAVILDPDKPVQGVFDSKQLSAKQREMLYTDITDKALAYSIVVIPPKRVDEINILQAVLEGMAEAINKLSVKPDLCIIDGNKLPNGLNYPAKAIVKGDSLYASIAAASIIAKVHRDLIMISYDQTYPSYGFAKHKGYPTRLHIEALRKHGPCPIHRITYGPVSQLDIWQNDFYD